VLSRILRGDTYNDSIPYYEKHLQALKDKGIMTQIDHPLERKEVRQRVRVMLMRSVEGGVLPYVDPDTTLLTRGYLAQVVVDYAVNVLGWKIPNSLGYCYFKDGANAYLSPSEKRYTVYACQLGLMGLDMDYFQPYTQVTQAQLAIVLYRLLYDPTYI
jgi:hypothetical protein